MSLALDAKIPDFTHTSTDDIYRLTDTLRATFRSNKTKDLKYRALCDALRKDLRKCKHEALLSEVEWCANDCLYMLKNLEKFAADEKCEDVPLTYAMLKPRIRKEPLGMILVIGAFNFPVQLTLIPIIGAIAAGCTAVLKPSESAPATAMVLTKIFETALDPKAYTVVNGAVEETQALLDVKWDKIMYTGSTAVGKIIAKKAAENLTPVTLELGGLNPAFITKHADVKLAARRLMWSKCLNAGQVCISQNYILADRAIVDDLIQGLNATLKEFFPSVLNEVTSGGATINDAFFHASIATVPFGGVGDSGTGNYRGRASFEAFTHRRSVAQTPSWMEKFIRVRYMPYSPKELARLQRMTADKPDFDRNGVQIRGLGYWVRFVVGLGASGAKGALLRWVLALRRRY
ncbi:aldehyde dehydrogenase [Colletotrichum higginsianum]|nr:aldehyde dehydrogenase [Colletotrichum higginsianum]